MSKDITLSETLYTAADLQGKESQCTQQELRELGDIARGLEGADDRAREFWDQNITDDANKVGGQTRGLGGLAIVHLLIERIQELER